MLDRRTIAVLSLLLAAFPLLAGEPTGDVAAMKKIEALQREAQQLYPQGMLRATVRTTNVNSFGTLEGELTGYWSGDLSRTEASYAEERVDGDQIATIRREEVEIARGTTTLFFALPTYTVEVRDRERSQDREHLACMPVHCWFGGDEASGRPWTWFLERFDEQTPVDRTTHTEVEGSLVRIRQVARKDGKQVGERTAVFDLDLAGMCVSFEGASAAGPEKGSSIWTLDDKGRPLLQSLSWQRTLRDGQVNSAEITIESFDPDFVVEEEQFSFELDQFEEGTRIVDERGKEIRTIRVGPGVTLDPAP